MSDLAAVARLGNYSRGQTVVLQGEPGNSLFAIHSGFLKVSVLGKKGSSSTLGVMRPGEIFGELALLDGGPRSATVVAQTRATVVIIDRGPFLDLVRAVSPIAAAMFDLLARRLRMVTERSDDLTVLSVSQRLAKLILFLGRQYGTSESATRVRIAIKLSQQDLGEMIGATRESVNKHLREWVGTGILEKSAGYLIILKPTQLQELPQH